MMMILIFVPFNLSNTQRDIRAHSFTNIRGHHSLINQRICSTSCARFNVFSVTYPEEVGPKVVIQIRTGTAVMKNDT